MDSISLRALQDTSYRRWETKNFGNDNLTVSPNRTTTSSSSTNHSSHLIKKHKKQKQKHAHSYLHAPFESEIDESWNRAQLQFQKWHQMDQQFNHHSFHKLRNISPSSLKNSVASDISSQWALDTYHEMTPLSNNIDISKRIVMKNVATQTSFNNQS